MSDYYPYRIATRGGDLTLIWRPGEGNVPDELAVDDRGRLLAFHDLKALQEHCDRNRWELIWEGEGTLDLVAVGRWIENPHRAQCRQGYCWTPGTSSKIYPTA